MLLLEKPKSKKAVGSGRKVCPNCRQVLHSKVSLCSCGFSFAAGKPIQSCFPLAAQLVQAFLAKHGINEPAEDTDEYAEALIALMRAAEEFPIHNPNGQLSTGAWAYMTKAIQHQFRKRHHRRLRYWQTDVFDEMPVEAEQGRVLLAHDILAAQPDDPPRVERDKPLLVRWMYGDSFKQIAARHRLSERAVKARINRLIQFYRGKQ